MRINKYLASCEIGSRRKVEQLIIDGLVKVNGVVVKELGTNISEEDTVEYNGNIVKPSQENIYIMLNKPKCYITSVSDDRERKTVIDLLKNIKGRIFPVGRLDYNTEGLLLLTNDGEFANNIMHPRKHIQKTYEVILKYKPTHSELTKLKQGVEIDGVKTLPAIISNPVQLEDERYMLDITIFEGKNREVRKMFESINYKVYNLKRIKIGELELGTLPMGKYKILTKEDIKKIWR